MVKSLKQKSSDMSKDGAPPNEREKTGRLMHHPRQDLYLIPLGTIGTAPGAVPTLDQPRINIRTKAHPNIIICCCRGREGALFSGHFAKYDTVRTTICGLALCICSPIIVSTRQPCASQPAAMMRRPHRQCILSNEVVVVGRPTEEKTM
jgi:hypothetical protein